MDHVSVLGARVVAFKPILRTLKVASTVSGTLLASQLLWEYQQNGRQPFAITDIELAACTGLHVDEVRNARKDITSPSDGGEPCFTYARRGFPTRGYWDVNVRALEARFSSRSQSEPQFGSSPELDASVRPITRTGENPVIEPVRPITRTEGKVQEPSEDSSSGHHPNSDPLQFGPSPELSISLRDLNNPLIPLPAGEPEKSEEKSPAESPAKSPATRRRKRQPQGPLDRLAEVDPATAELPAELEHCREQVVAFWLNHKSPSSAFSVMAFKSLATGLKQIQAKYGKQELADVFAAAEFWAEQKGNPWSGISLRQHEAARQRRGLSTDPQQPARQNPAHQLADERQLFRNAYGREPGPADGFPDPAPESSVPRC